MATPMLLDEIYEIRIWCSYQQQAGLNIRHFKVTEIIGLGSTREEVIGAFSTLVAPAYLAALSTGAEYRGMSMRRLVPGPPTVEVTTDNGRSTGSVTGDPLPSQISGVISLRTDFPGPGGRGRMYIPFPSEDDNNVNQVPQSSYVTRLGVIGSIFVDEIVLPQLPAPDRVRLLSVVYERVLGGTSPITGRIARSIWGTQRRRGGFGASNVVPV